MLIKLEVAVISILFVEDNIFLGNAEAFIQRLKYFASGRRLRLFLLRIMLRVILSDLNFHA